MRLSLGGKGEGASESGSGGVDVVFSCVAGFAGLLPVFSCVLASNSLIINEVSFSGSGAVLLVVWGFSQLGFWGWFWRNAFLSPSKKVSGFAGLLPVFLGVLASNSLIINGVSFSGVVEVLLVVLGLSSLGCCGWFWRNAFLRPSKKVSGFAGSLPVVSCVFWSNSLIINDISFSNIGLTFSTMEAWMAWSSGLVVSGLSKLPK